MIELAQVHIRRKGMNMNEYYNLTLEQIDLAIKGLSAPTTRVILSGADVVKRQELLMNAKQKKILDTYPIRIWQASNGTWKAHIPDDSKPRGRKVLQGKTKENLENNILKDYQEKNDNRLVFANYFVNWLFNYRVKEIQPPTVQRYYDDYKKHIMGTRFDKMKITEIEQTDIKNFLNDVINEKHLTRHALSNLKTLLNGTFEYALEEKEINTNPTASLKIRNTNITPENDSDVDSEAEVFGEDEFDVFVKYLYEHYMEHKPFITLAILLNFQLGLRVGELCTLKKKDINYKTCKIHIQRMERSYKPISLVDGKVVEGKTVHEVLEGQTKSNSKRLIDLSDEALAIINRTLGLHKEFGITSDFLFPDENGNHSIRQRFNDCLEYYCHQLAIDTRSSHKVRKTVFSNLFDKGFDIEEVMKIAGHRHKTTTLKYYLFSVKRKEDKRKRMNEALNSNHCPFGQPTVNPSLTA